MTLAGQSKDVPKLQVFSPLVKAFRKPEVCLCHLIRPTGGKFDEMENTTFLSRIEPQVGDNVTQRGGPRS
jgi:hypothetical protein